MTVKIIAVLECDSCGTVRGHEATKNLVDATRYLRSGAALSGWTVFGSQQQLDECSECQNDPHRTQQIRGVAA